jgi:hypothetical protein
MNIPDQLNKAADAVTKKSETFLQRILQSWKMWAGIAVVLVGLSVVFLVYALNAPAKSGPSPVTNVPTDTAPTSTVNLLQRGLDGVLVDASSTHLLPLGVMVENSADAWPLQGPAKANLVFESPVEGGITRFFLVFDASSTVDEIGPVRSARPYFVEWAQSLNALYAHVGGSPEALDNISKMPDFRDMNEFYNGWVFWRSKRAAPHNVYTRTDLLLQAVEKKGYVAGSFTPWTYSDATSTSESVTKINVPYDGLYGAEWRYDASTDEYVRYRNGALVKDMDGTSIRVKNVVMIQTEEQVLDEKGRLAVRTTGKGKALIFKGGEKHEATWLRSAGQFIRFEGIDGADVSFRRGKTWLSVITNPGAFASIVQ